MKKLFGSLSVALAVSLLLTAVAFANTPPPPVNQIIGIPDSVFANLEEADCRFCHEDPNIVDDANIPNRHHLKVGTPVPAGVCAVSNEACEKNTDCPQFDPTDPNMLEDTCSVHTDRPFPGGDTMGNYDCLSCHALVWDQNQMAFVLETFRDCTYCHIQSPLVATVHHRTTKAKNLECVACHGPINDPRIDEVTGEYVDGHIVPTYDPSLVTPCTGYDACTNVPYKDVNNLQPGDPGATGGYCSFCHNAGTVTDAQFTDAFPPPIDVRQNSVNHHSTGLVPLVGQGPSAPECSLCHLLLAPAAIRGCEACHGYQSLHNIQVDSNGGGVTPGGEDPWWGHVGQSSDCRGCHGFASAASAPGTGPIIPDIGILSTYNIEAGTDTAITISGSGLTNTVETPGGPVAVDSDVVLTAADGSTTTLTADAISDTSMTVTIPGTLAEGNYTLKAVKGSSQSNAAVISIYPGVTITGVDCNKKKGVLTITGSGFGTKPEGTDADINVEINGVMSGDIISWSDTEIKVSVGSCPRRSVVTVNTLYDSATLSSGKSKGDRPCRGKKC